MCEANRTGADHLVQVAVLVVHGVELVESDFGHASVSSRGGGQFAALAKLVAGGHDVVQFACSERHGIPLFSGMLESGTSLPAKRFRITGRLSARRTRQRHVE